MKKDNIKILFIGAGDITKQHLYVLNDLINLKNCWIYSRTKTKSKKLAKKYSIKNVEENYLSFIKQNKNEIEGVFILVSMDQIYQISKNILKFKIPTFIEKPPGLSLNELRKLNNLSIKYKTSNLVGYNRRYYSIIEYIKNKLKFEKILSAHVEGHERLWLIKKKVRKKSYLKKWTYANTSHVLNLLLFLLGNFKKVISISKNNFNKNIKVNTSAIIEFKNNIFSTFVSNWSVIGGWNIKIFGSKNTYLINPLEKCVLINKKFKEINISTKKYDLIYKKGFYNQAKFFIKIIKTKKYYNDLKNILSTYILIKKLFKN
jgi:predicted dehydrogenase